MVCKPLLMKPLNNKVMFIALSIFGVIMVGLLSYGIINEAKKSNSPKA